MSYTLRQALILQQPQARPVQHLPLAPNFGVLVEAGFLLLEPATMYVPIALSSAASSAKQVLLP